MKTFPRIAWAAALVSAGGCTTLLGVDNEYRLGSTATQGGGGDASNTGSGSTGGASATSSTGSVGGGESGASSSGTGGSSASSSAASSTGSGVPCVSDGGPCDCDNDKALATSCAMGTDCNDHNPLVYPGQKSFFKDKIVGTSSDYDYDCSGKDEYEITTVITCAPLNCSTTIVGWSGEPPACGQSGKFGTCKVTGLAACAENIQTTQVQRCH